MTDAYCTMAKCLTIEMVVYMFICIIKFTIDTWEILPVLSIYNVSVKSPYVVYNRDATKF
jgi:hypothetical protein